MTRIAPIPAPTTDSSAASVAAERTENTVHCSSRMEDPTVGSTRTTYDLALPDALAAHPFETATGSDGLSTAPKIAPDRPVALVPIFENIPAELKARVQWVLWRYEWVVNKQGVGKWTKVPYSRRDGKASTTRRTSWQSFESALARYHANRDYFDGIGYVFSADDPYVGGDRDHDLSTDGLPPTYTETSPSGGGNKFIARASGDYGRKTVRGELYSSKRFFTITGRVLPGREQITECQAEVEAFHASLGGRTRKSGGGGASANGSRAQLAADIPESEWEAGRQIARSSELNRTLARVRASAKEETQLAYLLRGDYADFHEKWPFVGLYRADGTLDQSQVRAVAANGIKPRGFTFPEYAAVMSHLYAADALAKWGTKDAWRAELAALWSKAPAPGYRRTAKPTPPPKAPRGRAGNHADLVERVYQILIDHRAGAEAIVTASQIAGVIYCARETVARILAELKASGRIATRRLPRHGGLVVTFLDVIYSDQPTAALPQPYAPNDAAPRPTLEETKHQERVSSDASGDHSLPPPPPIDALVRTALAALPRERLDAKTGQIKRWPITARRVLAWLDRLVPFYRISRTDLERIIPTKLATLRNEQRNARFAELRDMSADALAKELTSVSATIGRFDQRATEAATPEIAAWYQSEANKRRGRLAMLAAERADRDAREARRLAQFGYSQTEQAEMLATVDQARDPLAWRPGRAVKIAPEPSDAGEAMRQSLYAALRGLKAP